MHDAHAGCGSVTPPQVPVVGFVVGFVMGFVVGFVVPPPTAWQFGFDAQTAEHALPHWHLTMAV